MAGADAATAARRRAAGAPASSAASKAASSTSAAQKEAEALVWTDGLGLTPEHMAHIRDVYARSGSRKHYTALKRTLKEYRDWYQRASRPQQQPQQPQQHAAAAPAAASAAGMAAASGAARTADTKSAATTTNAVASAAVSRAMAHDDEWPGAYYVALHPSNPLRWRVWVCGGFQGAFHDLPLQLDVTFPDDYPWRTIKFTFVRSPTAAERGTAEREHKLCCWGRESWSPAFMLSKIVSWLSASAFVGTDLERANRRDMGDPGGGHDWRENGICMCELPARISAKTTPDARRWLDAARADPHQPFECHYYQPLNAATRTELARVLCGIVVTPPTAAAPTPSAAAAAAAAGTKAAAAGKPAPAAFPGTGPSGATATPAGLPWTHPLLPPELLPLVMQYCADAVEPGGMGVLRLKAERQGVYPSYPAGSVNPPQPIRHPCSMYA